MPHRFLACSLLVLAACDGSKAILEDSADVLAVDSAPAGVYVGAGAGPDATVPVFAVNALGAAVPSEGLSVQIGDAAPVLPEAEASGWVDVPAPGVSGSTAWDVTARLEGWEASGRLAWAAQDLPVWDALGMAPGGAGAASSSAFAGGGVAWASGGEVWWAAPGGAPVRVLALDGEVTGIVAVQADEDGVADLLVWSPGTVALLRGRDAGGLVWGAGWTPAEGSFGGAYVAQVTGGRPADVIVALALPGGTGRVAVLEGDGVWGFTPAERFDTNEVPRSLSLEDLDGDAKLEVTLLDTEGVLRRFARLGEGWGSTTTSMLYETGLGEGARLLPSQDCDGDGISDILAVGPLRDGSGWQAWVITLGGASPSMFRAYNDAGGRSTPASLNVAVGDLDGDGVADLALSSPEALTRGSWDTADGAASFRLYDMAALPEGPIALGDVNEDGVPDLGVATTSGVRLRNGERVEDDPATTDDESAAWRLALPTASRVETALVGPARVVDVTRDAVVDVVGFVIENGRLALRTWTGVRSAGSAEESLQGNTPAVQGTATEALDLAVCGARTFALVREADGQVGVRRWVIAANGTFSPQGGPFLVAGATAVTCGAFAQGEAAILQSTGGVSYLAVNGTLTPGAALSGGAGIAAADPDGDGVDTAVACATTGCSVVALDLDRDGFEEVVSAEEGVVTITWADRSEVLELSGSVTAADADGDGLVDLLVAEGGRVGVLLAAEGGPAPLQVRHTARKVDDPVMLGDLSGDRVPDAFWFGVSDGRRDGTIVRSRGTSPG